MKAANNTIKYPTILTIIINALSSLFLIDELIQESIGLKISLTANRAGEK